MSRYHSPPFKEEYLEFADEPPQTPPSNTPPLTAQDEEKLAKALEIYLAVYKEFSEEGFPEYEADMNYLRNGNSDLPVSLPEDSAWATEIPKNSAESRVISTQNCNIIKLEDTIESDEDRHYFLSEIQSQKRLYYYSCSPTSQNMEEELETWNMGPTFVPHADAPNERFNYVEYVRMGFEFEKLSEKLQVDSDIPKQFVWQNLMDPESDIVDFEVARRLHFQHQFSYDEIDRTGLLRLPLRDGSESGLIWESSQREPTRWESRQSNELTRFKTSYGDQNNTLLRFINAIQRGFCASINCIRMHCHAHSISSAPTIDTYLTPPIEPKKPERTHENLRLDYADRACDNDCFLNINEEMESMDAYMWDEKDRQALWELLELTPDAAPCDLAVLMCRGKRCVEIYLQRKLMLSDHDIHDWQLSSHERPPTPRDLSTPDLYTLNPARTKADVALMNRHAIATWRTNGVGASVDARTIVLIDFPVAIAKQVKDDVPMAQPQFAWLPVRVAATGENATLNGVHAKHDSPIHCNNSASQLEEQGLIEIKPSGHGQGAFATKTIEKSQFIIEYTGEIQHEVTSSLYE
ncbi:hypothetical protein D9757_008221 [Collybiopsis confluens]|uniref:SET domain-containing protein n=1 Tax=Collybiopsis confluens TaxID=2823264 RepID=A0A8H5M4C0_9AGAR|nr:hypothetical protein D9757_008221 [Collybiopsis confluens]